MAKFSARLPHESECLRSTVARRTIWYCGAGNATAWVTGPQFTTADNCPNVINFSVSSPNTNKANFSWDTTAAYSFVRIKLRVDTNNAAWFNAGGMGVNYPALGKQKGGLVAGTSYRAHARTWCNPNGGSYNSPSWTPLIFWTQPTIIRLEESTITNLDVFPNPSRDLFNISFTSKETQDLTLRVINVMGEMIIEDHLQQFTGNYVKEVDLSNYTKGVYFLEITTDNNVINKKLVLQ